MYLQNADMYCCWIAAIGIIANDLILLAFFCRHQTHVGIASR